MSQSFFSKASRRSMVVALGAAMAMGLGSVQAAGGAPAAIKERGVLRVGVLVDWAPYAGADARNLPDGYDADVAKLLAEDWGVKLEYVVMTGPNRIPFLLTDKADVLVASLAITPEREKQVQFSRPYSAASMVLFGPPKVKIDTPADFLKYKIGVPRASTTDLGVSKVAPEGTQLRRFDDDASALQAMLVGQIDSAGTSSVIAADMQKRHPGKFAVQYVINEQVMGITMQKNRPDLLEAVNAFIATNVANGKLKAMFEKRLGMQLPASVVQPKQ